MPAATLTEESVFPITRTWKRLANAMTATVVSGDYRIRRMGYSSFTDGYVVMHENTVISHHSRLATAKVAVEKHAAGFSTFVAWYNMPEGK